MKIDRDKLVELLVEKTSMERSDVEVQLEQLIERILDAARRGKTLEIKEFGSFFFDEDGELKFDPSDELSTEISYKYAGMKPVVLKAERDSTISPVNQSTEDVGSVGIAGVTGEGKQKIDSSERLPAHDTVSGKPLEKDTKPIAEQKQTTTSAPKRKPQPVQRKSSNVGVWLVTALILIALLVGGLFYLYDPAPGIENETAEETELAGPAPDELPVITDEQIPENIEIPPEFGAEQEPGNEVNEDGSGEGIPAEGQEIFGLMGAVVEDANDGYSIVLHSFNDEENARAAATDLSEQGYRALVNSRTVAGSPMWRVSVGQFETLADAQNAANELPTPHNTQNFIQRIQD